MAILVTVGLFALSGPSVAAQNATATPGVTITPEPDAPRLELEVEEFNDSGVSGTATLIEAGDQTIVEFDLEDTGGNHPAYIHPGSCDDLQPEPAFLLQNVGSDGQSTSVVDASLNDLIAGDFAVNLRISPNELGTIIVCADIAGEPQVPSPVASPGVTVAVTQTPAPTATVTVTATVTQVPTETPVPTATSTATPSPTRTPTATATAPATETPTQPPAPTATVTQAPTQPAAPTATDAPTQAPTATTSAIETPTVAANVADAATTVIAAAADVARAAITAATTAATEVETPITVDTSDDPAPTAIPETPVPATVISPPDGTGGAVNDSDDSASLPLPATSDLDISGTAVLTEVDDDTTRISVVLGGDDVSTDHVLHLHDGTCDEPGDFTLDLNPVDAEGISETDVDLSLEALLTDGYFIDVHLSEAAYGTQVACGDLAEATTGIVIPEVAPETEARGAGTDEIPITEATQVPEDQTPIAGATEPPDDQTPIAEATQAPDEQTPIAQATTPAVQTPRAGVTIVTTPDPATTAAASDVTVTGDGTSGAVADADAAAGKGRPVEPAAASTAVPTAVPTAAQVTVIGDGTSGDVGDSGAAAGKGSPVDPLTGLPRETGTGPLLPRGENGLDLVLWISTALALLAFAAAISVRRAGSRPSATPRPPARWTLPDI